MSATEAATAEHPACTPRDVGLTYTDETEQWVKDACESYFASFDAPRIANRKNGPLMSAAECSCGRPLGGFVGSFTWGLTYGEGYCSNCKRPGRAYHRLIDPRDQTEFASFGPVILLYRQSSVSPSDITREDV